MEELLSVLARGLKEGGLEHAFGVTGSGPTLRLIGLLESLGAQYHAASHEGAAAIMAGVVARVSGRVSASISIKGPGLANMLPGIVYNHYENSPAISIAEAYGPDAPASRRHKRLDQVALLRGVVKRRSSLGTGGVPLGSLLDLARAEVPGPVHVDLCVEPGPVPSGDEPPPATGRADEIIGRITQSSRPIVVAGSLACRRPWGARLGSLAVPVFTTAAARGVVDEKRAGVAGVFTGDGKELAPESSLFAKADLVVGLGLRNTEVTSAKPFGRPLVLIDEVGGGADGFGADECQLGASPGELDRAVDALAGKSWGAEDVTQAHQALVRHLLADPWLPAACYDELNRRPGPATLVLDTGSFCTIAEHIWRAGPDRLCVGSHNGRYMGGAIPAAIGAALAQPGRPVFAAVGDGGMGMYPAELRMAIDEHLPVCFVLMTDGRYGSIACVPQTGVASTRAITVSRPSWWKAVEALGCEAAAVTSRDEFAARIAAWRAQGPLFLEAAFDAKAYESMTAGVR